MAKNLKIILTTLLLLGGFNSFSQVSIDIDERINEQVRMKNGKIDTTNFSGYRIQIGFSSNRDDVQAAEAKFKARFPEFFDRTYFLYQQPYWKVRIGDYYREIDAQEMLKQIRIYFPDAFIVGDKIRRPLIKLLKN